MKVQKIRGAPRGSAPDHLDLLFTRTKMNENKLARKVSADEPVRAVVVATEGARTEKY